MSHLSRDERLLAVDDALEGSRAGHLATCAACRAEVEALRGVVARVRAVDVPEPSPLFWDHLAARVGDAIAHEPAPAPAPFWWRVPRWGWVAVATIVVVLGPLYLPTRSAVEAPAVANRGPAAVDPEAPSVEDATEALEAPDEGWGLIATMAEESDASAFAPQAGQSELSIAGLSKEERAALINELEAELAPRGGREG